MNVKKIKHIYMNLEKIVYHNAQMERFTTRIIVNVIILIK